MIGSYAAEAAHVRVVLSTAVGVVLDVEELCHVIEGQRVETDQPAERAFNAGLEDISLILSDLVI